MKVREGFVSNSSSSSFFIYGFTTTSSYDAVERLSKACAEIDSDDDCLDDAIAKAFKDSDISVETYCGYDDEYYVGVPISTMDDDESKNQFKERVGKALKQKFGDDIALDWHSGEYPC